MSRCSCTRRRPALLGVLVASGLAAAVAAATSPRAGSAAAENSAQAHQAAGETSWVASWSSSQRIPEPRNTLPAGELREATLREIVHLSIGGTVLRVRFSNAFGLAPLHIAAAHIARSVSLASGKIDPSTDRELEFSGKPDVIIPAGAEYLSDPVAFASPPLSDVAVSLYLPLAPERQTSHPGSRETSFLVHGNQVSAPDLAGALRVEHWYFLSGIAVRAPAGAASVVTLGDSITDGHASTTNGNDRWPDDLARRFAASPSLQGTGVANAGIGGNRLLEDGLGPNALARFDRDVLGQAGVRDLIVLEGINDLGGATAGAALSPHAHRELVARIIAAYAQLVARAHAHGIRVMGGTLMPDGASAIYHPDAAAEADREAINRWIRAPGSFDAFVDFDAVLRDPAHPDRLLPAYDSGDHLHPSPAGYRAMARAIPLGFFEHAGASPAAARPSRAHAW